MRFDKFFYHYFADILLKADKHFKKVIPSLQTVNGYAKVEITVLANLIWKNHNRFRNDKGFKDLKIVKKCALRMYQELKLEAILSNFASSFPLAFDMKSASKIYLPTSYMAHYALVRLYGSAQLLKKLICYCENAFRFAKMRLHLGHFWNIAMYSSACVSRIW